MEENFEKTPEKLTLEKIMEKIGYLENELPELDCQISEIEAELNHLESKTNQTQDVNVKTIKEIKYLLENKLPKLDCQISEIEAELNHLESKTNQAQDVKSSVEELRLKKIIEKIKYIRKELSKSGCRNLEIESKIKDKLNYFKNKISDSSSRVKKGESVNVVKKIPKQEKLTIKLEK